MKIVAICICVVLGICVIDMMRSHIMLERLERYNPLKDNDSVRSLVTSAPDKETTAGVYDVIASMNTVSTTDADYELMVLANYGKAKELKEKISAKGFVMFNGHPFTTVFKGVRQSAFGEAYWFLLNKEDGYEGENIHNMQMSKFFKMHILAF